MGRARSFFSLFSGSVYSFSPEWRFAAINMMALLMLPLMVSSCDEPEGYLDDGQQGRIELLTQYEWLNTSVKNPPFEEQLFDKETIAYKFDRNGKGRCYRASLVDPDVHEVIDYFEWTFTNDNFAVLYMRGSIIDDYWLIDKLTETELHVTSSTMDPVLYPNADKAWYKFVSRIPEAD